MSRPLHPRNSHIFPVFVYGQPLGFLPEYRDLRMSSEPWFVTPWERRATTSCVHLISWSCRDRENGLHHLLPISSQFIVHLSINESERRTVRDMTSTVGQMLSGTLNRQVNPAVLGLALHRQAKLPSDSSLGMVKVALYLPICLGTIHCTQSQLARYGLQEVL